MVAVYLVLKWVHVLAAAYLVGAFVTEWALRVFAARSKNPAHRAFAWDFLVKGEEKVAIPFALVLLVSGLLMVYGPWAGGWSLRSDGWLAAGLALFFVILVLMAGVAGSAAKKVAAAYAAGQGERAAARHERVYAWTSYVGAALVAIVVFLMVVKPF